MRAFSKHQNADNNPYLRNKEEADKFLSYSKQRNTNNAALTLKKSIGQSTMKTSIENLRMQLSQATTPEKVQLIKNHAINARDELDDIANQATAQRDELSDFIEMCITKESQTHPKPQYDC